MNLLNKMSLAAIGITVCAVTYDDIKQEFEGLFEASASILSMPSPMAEPPHSYNICEHDDIKHENCVDLLELGLNTLKKKPNILKKRISRKELFCLAQNIYFEARGEGIDGMTAVGEITLNRVDSPEFPNNVCDVVFQKKRKDGKWVPQMEWTVENNNPVSRSKPISNKEYYMNIAAKIVSGIYGTGHGEVCQALFWVNPKKIKDRDRSWHADKYFSNKTPCSFRVGNHAFFNYEK